MNILIIGYGRIGKALFKILKNKKYNIKIFDKKTKNSYKNLEKIQEMDFIFLCLPTKNIREFLKEIKTNKKEINPKTIFIILSKGIEEKTNKLPFEIVNEYLPKNKIAILGGALMAEELKNNKKAICFLAIETKKDFKKIEKIFQNTNIKINHFNNKKALNLVGVLKNIYTLFLTFIDNLKLGLNLKSFYLSLASKEIEKIILQLTNKKQIKNLDLIILSDLIITNFSQYSNNKKQALLFLKNKNYKESEGFYSLKTILKLIKNKKEYFILNLIEKIFLKKENVKQIIY